MKVRIMKKKYVVNLVLEKSVFPKKSIDLWSSQRSPASDEVKIIVIQKLKSTRK